MFPATACKLRPTTHTVIYLRALYPCRSLKPKPLSSCSCIPKPMFYFPGDLVGPDPSSRLYCIFRDSWTRWSRWSCWSHRSSPLRFVLYFPGLMRARRLRLNRHHRQWILPLSSNYIFQAGGAASRPWQKVICSWRSGSILARRCAQVKYLVPGISCLVFAASCIIFSGLRGPFRFDSETVNYPSSI